MKNFDPKKIPSGADMASILKKAAAQVASKFTAVVTGSFIKSPSGIYVPAAMEAKGIAPWPSGNSTSDYDEMPPMSEAILAAYAAKRGEISKDMQAKIWRWERCIETEARIPADFENRGKLAGLLVDAEDRFNDRLAKVAAKHQMKLTY